MSQYPPAYNQYPGGQPFLEQRTSALAVISLVFALICCIPGPAVLGAIFGVAALMVISGSNGRLVGRGLALAGIIISLLVCSVWIGIAVGGRYVWGRYKTEVVPPMREAFTALDTGDYKTFRTLLTPQANARISDSDIDAFRAAYQAELGHVVGPPETPVSFFNSMKGAYKGIESASGRNDVAPVILLFDRGPGVALLQVDASAPSSSQSSPGKGEIVNVIIASGKGTKWTLWDPARIPGAGNTPGTPSTSGNETPKPNADKPTTPEAEKPKEAAPDKPTDTPKPPTGG